MNYHCLIVDDELELAETTSEYFNMFDVKTYYVTSAEECLQFLEQHNTELILLDINLGQDSGFDLCKKLRATTQIPILFISARSSDDDVLIALNIGGDDYIHKPYTLSILLAKVRAVLKRYGGQQQLETLAFGDVYIDRDKNRVRVKGKEISLKTMEFKLLCYLAENKNRIISKDELFRKVWGDVITGDGTLNVHIRHLREKIEENPNEPIYIKTIWGTGYMLEDQPL